MALEEAQDLVLEAAARPLLFLCELAKMIDDQLWTRGGRVVARRSKLLICYTDFTDSRSLGYHVGY